MQENTVYTAVTQPAFFGPMPIYYMMAWLISLLVTQLFGLGLIVLVVFAIPSFLILFFAAQKEPRYLEMLAVKAKCFGLNEVLGAARNVFGA
ncbi:MAG: VirB3 family type IV secretion system protein [Rhizobiaceae bacterium]